MINKKILYVEDDVGSRKVMQGLIESLNSPIELTIFNDSVDFINRVELLTPEPDVFLLDIHVSPLDGFDMLTLLRQHPHFQHKAVIALTASVMNDEVQQLKASGFDGILAKPLSFRDFPNMMQRIFSGERIWKVIS